MDFTINFGDILNSVISLVLGAIITLGFIESKKTKQKRKILLDIILRELEAYEGHDDDYEVGAPGIGTPQRNQIFWTVLSSDVLDVEKDKELIWGLQEMVGWIENYNSMNNMANLD